MLKSGLVDQTVIQKESLFSLKENVNNPFSLTLFKSLQCINNLLSRTGEVMNCRCVQRQKDTSKVNFKIYNASLNFLISRRVCLDYYFHLYKNTILILMLREQTHLCVKLGPFQLLAASSVEPFILSVHPLLDLLVLLGSISTVAWCLMPS